MYGRNLAVQIHSLGGEAEVLTRSETGTNEFGNPTDEYTPQRTILAMKTYPNRNTEVESSSGDRHRDRPVLISPDVSSQPEPPGEEDRVSFDGTLYEVKALTEYDTHVEYFCEVVINENSDG